MTPIILDTHNAIKRLQSAGWSEGQAEQMLSLIAEIRTNEAATKNDIELLHRDLKADLEDVTTDLSLGDNFMFGVGVVVAIAALKYIFFG